MRHEPRWIDDAIHCVHPFATKTTPFAMLKCYMDESGIHNSAAACVVAGFVGKVRHWSGFESDWREILARHQIEEFHAKVFFARDDKGGRVREYKLWDDHKAKRFIDQLLAVIKSYKIRLLGSAVHVSVFNSYSEHERRFLTCGIYRRGRWIRSGAPTKPYYLPFSHCVIEATQQCLLGEKVHYFFDLNEQLSQWAMEVYKDLRRSDELEARRYLGQIAFPTSLDAPGLQAADLACWELNRLIRSAEEFVERSPSSELLNRLMAHGGRVYGFTKDVINECLKACPSPLQNQ